MIQPDFKDSVLCVVKIGDNGDYRDGELVEVIDPAEWDVEKFEYSDHMGKVYRGELRPLEAKDKLRQAVAYNAMQRMIFKSNVRKVVDDKAAIYYAKIGAVIDATTATEAEKVAEKSDKAVMLDTTVKVGWYEKDTIVPIVDAKALADTGIVEKDFTGLPTVPDFNTVSSGSYTLGSGGNYATVVAFAADLANLTGHLTGTAISAITETTYANFGIVIGDYNLTLTADTATSGNPNAGRKISDVYIYFNGIVSTTGTFIIENLFLAGGASFPPLVTAAGGFTSNVTIRNCILQPNSAKQVISANSTYSTIVSGKTVLITGCKMFGGTTALNLYNQGTTVIENCVLHNFSAAGIDFNGADGTAKTVRNTAIMSCTANDIVNLGTNLTATNCGTDQAAAFGAATETATVNSITNADFASVTSSANDYLDINAASDLYQTGADGSYATISINGVTRVSGSWSIGAHEPEAAASTPIPVFMNHYRQMRRK